MREIRPSGSGGGARGNPLLLPYPPTPARLVAARPPIRTAEHRRPTGGGAALRAACCQVAARPLHHLDFVGLPHFDASALGRVVFVSSRYFAVSSRVIDRVLAIWSALQDRRGVFGAEAPHRVSEEAHWATISGVSDTLRLKIGRRFAV